MRKILIIFVLIILTFNIFPESKLVKLDDKNFDKTVEGKLVFVDFYADWCGPCVNFAPTFEKTANNVTSNMFIKIDVDKSPKLSSRYKIKYIPYVVAILNKEVVKQYQGNRTYEDFKKWCEELITKYGNKSEEKETRAKEGRKNLVRLNDENFYLKTKNMLIFVDFYADWCNPCKSFDPIFEKYSKKYNNNLFVKIDIDKNPKLSKDFKIQYIPHLAAVYNGKVIDSLTGLYDEDIYDKFFMKNINNSDKISLTENSDNKREGSKNKYGKLVKLGDKNFYDTVKGKLVFIDFYADWCGPCKTFAPVFKEAAEMIGTNMFVKVDIDSNPQLSNDFKIKYIPYIVAVYDGKLIDEFTDVRSVSGFNSWCKDMIEEYNNK